MPSAPITARVPLTQKTIASRFHRSAVHTASPWSGEEPVTLLA